MRPMSAFLVTGGIFLGACKDEDFDARFEREQETINRQVAEIDSRMANDMAAAREAEEATGEIRNMADDK